MAYYFCIGNVKDTMAFSEEFLKMNIPSMLNCKFLKESIRKITFPKL